MSQPALTPLEVTKAHLRDRITLSLDRELVDEIDAQRGGVPRSDYVEMVLVAAFAREHPHLPPDWTPERSAEAAFARAVRFLETGR